MVAYVEEADSYSEKVAIIGNIPGKGSVELEVHGSGYKTGKPETFNKCQTRNIGFVGQLQLAQR